MEEIVNEDEDVKEERQKAAQNEGIQVNVALDFCRN